MTRPLFFVVVLLAAAPCLPGQDLPVPPPPVSTRPGAEYVDFVAAKVNRAVTRLVAAGLILAGTSSRDRRVNVLKLTARGRKIYEKIVPMALDHERSLLDPLSKAEVTTGAKPIGDQPISDESPAFAGLDGKKGRTSQS